MEFSSRALALPVGLIPFIAITNKKVLNRSNQEGGHRCGCKYFISTWHFGRKKGWHRPVGVILIRFREEIFQGKKVLCMKKGQLKYPVNW